MEYNINWAEQLRRLMPALGLGFILGFLYDFVRLLRLCFPNGKVLSFISDALSLIVCTVVSYFMILAVNNGNVRAFLLLSELAGFIIYRCSLGVPVYGLCLRISSFSEKSRRVISAPFKKLFRKIKEKHKSETEKAEKTGGRFTKSKNNLKKLLKHPKKNGII